MQVHRKSIRDFVGDVRSTPRPRPELGDPPYEAPKHRWPNIVVYPTITRERMWGKGANQPLEVDVYSIAPGEEDPPHFHPDHIELVICWRGRGWVTIQKTTGGPVFEIAIERGDSIVVPKGARHKFTASREEIMAIPNPAQRPVPIPSPTPPPITIDRSKTWPVEKMELVVIHAHGCVRVEDKAPLDATKTLDRNDQKDNDLYSLMRPIGRFCGYARDTQLQSVRSRVWGREAERNVNGGADDAKTTLHFTAYTFVPGQENPEHYHPHSVEFVMCLQGRAKMTVRPRIDATDFAPGWEDPYEVAELNEGDTVLVPVSALHWYGNGSNEDCVLIALQSPHPILHILEDDATVDPAPKNPAKKAHNP